MNFKSKILYCFPILMTLPVTLKSCKQEKKPKNEKTNIIFFIVDDMRRSMFNCLSEGKDQYLSPNIDHLAEEGLVMYDQYVSSTVCSPSRYSCLTGKYASRAQNPDFLNFMKENDGQAVIQWNTMINPGETNLASLLKEQGYVTGAVGKNHVIDVPDWVAVPLDADTSDHKVMQELRKDNEKLKNAYLNCGFDYAEGLWYNNPDYNGPLSLAKHNMDWTTEKALDFLENVKDTSFFLYFATTIPHGPVAADRSWNADRTIVPYGRLKKAPDVLPPKESIPARLIKKGLAKAGNIPDRKANILWLDDVLGTIIDKLKSSGNYDNTIIVFFTDHGQDAKGTVYQDGTLAPSIIWKKDGFQALGNSTHTLVSNIDFAPTLYEIAGGDPSSVDFDGKSFCKLLEGDTSRIHSAMFFEMGYSRGILKDSIKYIALRYPEKIKNMSLEKRRKILDDWNDLLRMRGKDPNNTDPMKPFGHVQIIPGGGDAEFAATKRYPHYTDPDQLYDLRTDPNEQHNLANDPAYQDIMEDLKQELKVQLLKMPGSFGEFTR